MKWNKIRTQSHSLAERSRVISWTDAGVSRVFSHTGASVLTAMLLAFVHLFLAVLPNVSGRALALIVPRQILALSPDAGPLAALVYVLLAAFARPSRGTFAVKEIEEVRARAVVLARLGKTQEGAGAPQLRLRHPANSDEL